MTAGDVAARKILEKAGYTADEARELTLTSEPFTNFGHSLSRIGKGAEGESSPLADMMFPFKRTPVNVMEQGALRTPGLGSLLQGKRAAATGLDAPDLKAQAIQQLLGAGVFGGEAAIGSQLSPEQIRYLRPYLTNIAGPYAALAAAGLATGQAVQKGQNPLTAAALAPIREIPLPSTDVLEGIVESGQNLAEGNIQAPRGSYPTILRDLARVKNPQPSEAGSGRIQSLPPLRSF
jgi:hypothetical protein